jgi:hypothetical protein
MRNSILTESEANEVLLYHSSCNKFFILQLLKALLRWPILHLEEVILQDRDYQEIKVDIRQEKEKMSKIQLLPVTSYKLRILLSLHGPNRVQFFLTLIVK